MLEENVQRSCSQRFFWQSLGHRGQSICDMTGRVPLRQVMFLGLRNCLESELWKVNWSGFAPIIITGKLESTTNHLEQELLSSYLQRQL